ncbi:ROK family protein [Salipaludibacillus aurantiacus]|uniref:Beta-glucoside kinase n=1 Tax=Salipaludibacillus aurantiacus TaxID=1601833 RepID=A0A1H9WIZ9_9BACI|nr:ROK family protein [Salipaludibacillus aurantiacus]SES33801.1 beta-glucoside kinase [Salipaludibacillus aurantiacus]
MRLQHYLSLDIGGTDVKWGILTSKGGIIKKDSFPSKADGGTILAGIKEIISDNYQEICGVAISMPGFINPESGFIEKGGAIVAFDKFNLANVLNEEFNLPVSIENDVNCVALAEKWLGNGQNLSDFICLTVGTGIGGALILNNQLYRGNAFRGGEFGYMITHGIQMTTPLKGSLHQAASLYSLRKKYANYHSLPASKVTGEMVFQSYDAGDPAAEQIVSSFYQNLAIGIYNVASVLDPQKVLIGGGITSRPTFLKEVKHQLLYIDQLFNIDIDTCLFKNNAGMIGALAFHLEKYGNG